MRKRLERRKERVGEIDWCACGRAKSEKGRRRASSGREVVGQVRWGRKGKAAEGRGRGEGALASDSRCRARPPLAASQASSKQSQSRRLTSIARLTFSPSYKIVSCIYLPRSISRSLRRRSSLFVVAIAAATAAAAAAATAVVIVAHAVRRRYCSCNRRLVARGF